MCFLVLFAERLRSKITFKSFGGRFEPLGFNARWGFFSQIYQQAKEYLYGNFQKNRSGTFIHQKFSKNF